MSFAAGAFLLGLLGLGLPWWLHRRKTRRGELRTVSSLLLMRPGEAPQRRRSAIRHRLLLAARLLLLAVLVLAFAQPLFERGRPEPAAQASLRDRVIVLDASLSMAAGFDTARRQARALIEGLPPGGRAAVVVAGAELVVTAPLTGDRGALQAAVAAAEPGFARLGFDGLTRRLAILAGGLGDRPVEVHLISDFQGSAMPPQFNALVASADVPMRLHRVPGADANWSVERVVHDDQAVHVTVSSAGGPERELTVALTASGGERYWRSLTVPADGRATVTFPRSETGRQDVWVRAEVSADDALPGDDVRHQVIRQSDLLDLPLFAPAGAERQVAYLRAAVAAAAPGFRLAGPDARGPVSVAVDPAGLAEAPRRELLSHLGNGGSVLVVAGPATELAGRLPGLRARLEPAAATATARGIGSVDRGHPAVAGVSGWDDVRVARHLGVASASLGPALLRLDDGAPLLLEARLEGGRALVLLTALDPAWSSLVVKPAFVEFVGRALAYLADDLLPVEAVTGQPFAVRGRQVQVFDADRRPLLSLADTVDRGTVTVAEPGLYTLRSGARSRLLAVNPDRRESDPAPAEPALLARWQQALAHGAAAGPAAAAPSAEAGSAAAGYRSLAPWLLAVLVLLAVLEPVLANVTRPEATP